MASKHWITYVLLSFYILSMIIVTIIANIKNRIHNKAKTIQSIHSDDDLITTHFLGSKAFGPFILLLTTFASLFSGYTIVGVPDESGRNGFTAIRWIGGTICVAISFLMIFPRIRRLSIMRNYESPGDFIADRYSSKPLSVLMVICLCVPQLLYLAVQIYSLGNILSSLTDGELSFYSVIIVSTLLILIFEICGGMRSVAYTDSVQAIIMIAVFIAIPIVIGIQYGGFMGQVTNSEHLPCDNSNMDETSGCLNYSDGGDIGDEYYLRTPSSLSVINYIIFVLTMLATSINPHLLQRALSAKEDWQLRFVVKSIFIAAFSTMIPGVLIGITYISNYNDLKVEYQGFSAFSAILAVFKDEGGFKAFLSYFAMLAGIAGIMSTADSALIGVSNTICCDIFKNWLTPNLSNKKIIYIGEVISLCIMLLSVGFALYIKESQMEYGVLLVMQNGILFQGVPAFIFGLYTNIGTKTILCGIQVGLITDIILFGIVFSGNDPFGAINTALTDLDKGWVSLIGIIINLLICFIGHFICGWRDYFDEKSNIQLSIHKIKEIMVGITEPLTRFYGLFVWLSLISVLISAHHWIGDIDPALIQKFGKKEVESFIYNGYISKYVIGGLPLWSFASMIWYVIAATFGLIACLLWSVDEINDDKLPSNHISEEQQEFNYNSNENQEYIVESDGV